MNSINLKTQTLPAKIASFKCSDETLNSIWEIGVNTLAAGQCKAGARVEALLNYYIFGETKLTAKILQSTDTDRDLLWVMMLKDYSDYTASGLILEKLYPDLEKVIEALPPSQVCPICHKALVDASELAARARDFNKAQAWRERAKQVHQAINERLWDNAKGVYTDSNGTISERTNYLAILFDIADEDKARKIMAYMDSNQPCICNIEPFYLLETLAKTGRYQQALDIIRQDQHITSIYWLMKHVAGIQLPDATYRLPYTLEPQLCDLQWVKVRLGGLRVSIP